MGSPLGESPEISAARVNKRRFPAAPETADLLGKVPQTDSRLNSEELPCCPPACPLLPAAPSFSN